MRKLLLLIVFMLMPIVATAQLSVGIMSPDDVLDALPEMSEVESELQSYVNERERNFEQRYQTFIERITELSERAEAGELSEAEQAEAEEEIAEMEEDLQNLQNRIQRQIRERQDQLFSPLLNRVEAAMEAVAKENGIDYVINKSTSNGDPIVYYASERGLDITQDVINYLLEN